MVRATLDFKSNYSLSVESVVRGHHVNKETWNPYKVEKLMCNHNKREEATVYLRIMLLVLIKLFALSVMLQSNYLFWFVNLSRIEITKYLLK